MCHSNSSLLDPSPSSLTDNSLPLHFHHLTVTFNHLVHRQQDCLVVWPYKVRSVRGHPCPSTVGPLFTGVERADPSVMEEDETEEISYVTTRGDRLSAPQPQAKLPWLTDRTRLLRSKGTLQAKDAWQQVVRNKDLCDMHVTHKWLFH